MASSMASTKSMAIATLAIPTSSPSLPSGCFGNFLRRCQCNYAYIGDKSGKSKGPFVRHDLNFKQVVRPISAVSSGNFPCARHHLPISENKVVGNIINRGDESLGTFTRRAALGLALLLSNLNINMNDARGAGLPPEEKPRLCDAECEKELENVPLVTTESGLQYKDIVVGNGPSPPVGFQVAANYVAMVPSGQIFDSSLEKGLPYLFRIGSGQVIKGLDEGVLTMKVGGKRRLYIPGTLSFPKGLNSAPGRPRVPPNSPVVFDVSLEYVPGLELDIED